LNGGSVLSPRTNGINPLYKEQIVRILEHSFWLKKEGYRESTISSSIASLKSLAKSSDLLNPETVKENIANRPISEGTKEKLVQVYVRARE
jgi:hypothetical protein